MRHITTKTKKAVHAAHRWLHHKAHEVFTRRVFTIACIALALQIAVEFCHFHIFGKMGELFTASIIEHIFINVPLLDE